MQTGSVVARPVVAVSAAPGAGMALAGSEPRRTPLARRLARPIACVLKRAATLLAPVAGAGDIEADPCWLAWEVAVLD
jgi:hypothetical protein